MMDGTGPMVRYTGKWQHWMHPLPTALPFPPSHLLPLPSPSTSHLFCFLTVTALPLTVDLFFHPPCLSLPPPSALPTPLSPLQAASEPSSQGVAAAGAEGGRSREGSGDASGGGATVGQEREGEAAGRKEAAEGGEDGGHSGDKERGDGRGGGAGEAAEVLAADLGGKVALCLTNSHQVRGCRGRCCVTGLALCSG